jgi:hypothetical protein
LRRIRAAAPDLDAAAVVYERFALCSLGCGWLSRAVPWLECERWRVGMAVPEGGVGSPFGVTEQVDVRAAAPRFDNVESIDLVLADDEVPLDVGRRHVVQLEG